MSAIFINSTTSTGSGSIPMTKPKKVVNSSRPKPVSLPPLPTVPQEDEKMEPETEKSREERKATGRTIAIVIFLSLMCLALYHVVQKKTTILAGVLVPALILFSYLFFVIHVSQREKERRRKQLEEADIELSMQSDSVKMGYNKKISTVSNPSISSASLPSTSGLIMASSRGLPKGQLPKSSSLGKMDLKSAKILIDPKGIPPTTKNSSMNAKKPFKKAQSQSHIQVKSNQSAHISIEHETKKLKKSRSFDKNNLVEPRHHMIDNKKIKTKH